MQREQAAQHQRQTRPGLPGGSAGKEVQSPDQAGLRIMHQTGAAAAQTGTGRQRHGHGHRHRHGGIGGASALCQHVATGQRGSRLIAGDGNAEDGGVAARSLGAASYEGHCDKDSTDQTQFSAS